ncbi:hypothetical protein SAMN06296386_1261 [Lachnospiraceae bacterium]|nr:hypothetical protein SAMN06296386_1261 [Lachnospiraceae bacterium]
MFVSDYFKLNEEQYEKFREMGVFDVLIDRDSNFFINILRLKESTVPEFIEAYRNLNKFFSDIATLLDAADEPDPKDKMYKSAQKKFKFHEVNGINLGFSCSSHGSGWGRALAEQFLKDAYQIVKKGSKQPEIFHLASLFEDKVAGDRLSDMIATIIEPEIKKYTLRVMKELGIEKEKYPNFNYYSDGLIKNPYKNAPLLLLPIEILHELPIAQNWDDIDRVVSENNTIRNEISTEVGDRWSRWASEEKKKYLLKNVFMNQEACRRVIDGYKMENLGALDLKNDPDYLAELLFRKMFQSIEFLSEKKEPSSFEAMMKVIGIFKDWVENNRGWAEIQEAPRRRREKAVQRCIHLGAKHYVEVNNLAISFEPDAGRGPVDIKMSRGNDVTLAEIKLSSNSQYIHGYEEQIQEYGAAERTDSLVYVLIDVGNPKRVRDIKSLHEKNKALGIKCPELIIIDANERKAASTYKAEESSLDFELDIEEMDLSEMDLFETGIV